MYRNRYLVSIFIIITIFFSTAYASENENSYDPIQTALALNYCQMSICKIVTYNNKIVLDQEYDSIINNINLSKIEDKEIINLLMSIMDTLTKSKLADKEKYFINKEYEKKVEKAVYDSLQNSIGNIAGAATGFATGDYAGATKNLTQVGMQYFNYKKMIEEQKDNLEKVNWEIDKETISFLNYQRKRLLSTAWKLIKRYNLPDKWRLTEKQINNYIEILKDEQTDRCFRKLQRISDDFQAYPPFWYYYGKTAQELGDNALALEYYAKYESVRKGIFRQDRFYASTCLNRIELTDNIEEIKRNLEIISNQAKDNNNLVLLCALHYMKLGKFSIAANLLQKNIDDNYHISLNERLLGEVLLAQNDKTDVNQLISEMENNDKVKNQDLICLIGKMSEIDKLKLIKEQIRGIKLLFDSNILSKDDVVVKIPVKWFFEDLKVTLSYNGKTFTSSSYKSDEKEKIINCIFKEVAEESSIIDKPASGTFTVNMDHPSYPIKIIFESEMHTCNKNTLSKDISDNKYTPKWLRKKIHNNLSDTKDVRILTTTIKQIISGNEKYKFENGELKKI